MKIINPKLIITTAVVIIWACLGFFEVLSAQSTLTRISLSERSDNQGFVIRFHLSEPVDSFSLAQSKQSRIQFKLYGSEIFINEPLILPQSDVIERLISFHSDQHLIFDFLLYDEHTFEVTAYPDVNQKDLLLALTYNASPLPDRALSDYMFTKGQKVTHFDKTPTEDSGNAIAESSSPTPKIQQIESMGNSSNEDDNTGIQHVSPGDPMEFYLRWIGELSKNTRVNRHLRYSGSTDYLAVEHDHPWRNHAFFSKKDENFSHPNLILFNPVIFSSYNTDYPVGGNDGAMWQGRGWNQSLSAGIGYKNDLLEFVFRPVYVHSENRPFELSRTPQYEGLSEYAMALTHSDNPQRFGADSFYRFDLGETFLKFKYQGWSAGVSNERIRTSPAVHNPLLFGYNAPGFMHTFIGVDEPINGLNGLIDFQLFWGNLKGSDYFYPDDEEFNNMPERRFITGLTVNYNPDFLQGLHLGLTRTSVSYIPESGFGITDLAMVFQRSQKKTDDIDPYDARLTKTSFFIRWNFPEAGIETYAEWGRYDNQRRIRDIFLEPELNRAYVLGFIKRFRVGSSRRILLNGEITNLENSSVTTQSRDFNIWYTHPIIKHGFTHRGKVLGAPIGPGSSTQNVSLSYYDRFGMAGFTLGRIAYHNDRFFKNIDFFRENRDRPWIPIYFFQEIEMYGSAQVLIFIPGGLELQANARYGLIENRNNQFNVDTSGGIVRRFFFDEPNWNLSFTLRYQLSNRNR